MKEGKTSVANNQQSENVGNYSYFSKNEEGRGTTSSSILPDIGSTNESYPCPCRNFSSIQHIRLMLESKALVEEFVNWISDASSVQCGSLMYCSRRGHASLLLLNAIRDACRPFLEVKEGLKQKILGPEASPSTYEDAFPSLSTSVLPITPLAKPASKPKKRVRPVVVQQSVWGSSGISTATGNLVNLPSSDEQFRLPLKPSPTTTATLPFMPQRGKSEQCSSTALPAPVLKSTPTTETRESIEKSPELVNLVSVYVALFSNCLVPSSAVELQLLLRLLVLAPDQAPQSTVPVVPSELTTILLTPLHCNVFSSIVLSRLSSLLVRFGPKFLQDLVCCQAFCNQLPDLTEQLKQTLNHQLSLPLETLKQQTALLTLPFNEQRDSRHNYKSRTEQDIYKNREETRDTFLSQLRSFLNVRGRALDDTHMERAMDRIQVEARLIVNSLVDANVNWFVVFFCDLLLQIGLVALEETDRELLQITNKDKLQKLHQRFSSKPRGQENSSRKLVFDTQTASQSSPVEEAQHLFPGHQEFFFIFVMSADSYRFGTHLRSHLISTIKGRSSDIVFYNLECQVLKLCMLSRFLGVLLFYPNWQCTESRNTSFVTTADALLQLAASGLSLVEHAKVAYQSGRMISTLPWIIELIQMARWDVAMKSSSEYILVASLLRKIQVHLQVADHYTPPMSIVAFYLERLFGEIIGISRTSFLNNILLPRDNRSPTMNIDDAELAFSSAARYAANPDIEELEAFVSRLARVNISTLRSPGVSRKLRPMSVNSPPHELLSAPNFTTVSAKHVSIFHASIPDQDPIKTKLMNTFFHQHQDLKEVCDFLAKRVLDVEVTRAMNEIVKPRLKGNVDNGDSSWACFERDVMDSCLDAIRILLTTNVASALSAIYATSKAQKVLQVAVSLTTSSAMVTCKMILRPLIAADVALAQSATSSSSKRLFEGEHANITTKSTSGLDIVTNAVDKLLTNIEQHGGNFTKIESYVHAVSKVLNMSIESRDAHIPLDTELRSFFKAFLSLNGHARALLEWAISSTRVAPEKRWRVLLPFLHIACKIKVWARHGLAEVGRLFAENPSSLRAVVCLALEARESSDKLGSLLYLMVDSRLVKCGVVEETIALHCHCVEGVSLGNSFLALMERSTCLPNELDTLRQALGRS
jgi:hypothetical protein